MTGTTRFNFDAVISRQGTHSEKWDGRQQQFGNANICPLWVADMDFASPPCVVEALQARALHPIYGYTQHPSSLFSAVIGWLERRHHWQITQDWILMVPGVVTALHAAALALVPENAGIIVQPPVYFPFFSSVTKTQRKLLLNPLQLQNGHYTIDFAQLKQLAPEAHMIVLCSPHNPVGRVWQKFELLQLLRIAKHHNLLIFSDDIHADLILPGHQHQMLAALVTDPDCAEFAEFINTNVITAVAPSKTFNIPGLSLSSLIVPNPELRKKLQNTLGLLHIGIFNPFSIAACEAAYTHGDDWLDALMLYLNNTKHRVADYLIKNLPQIKLIEPQGTYLLWLDCRALNLDDKQLQRFFIEDCGLGLSPGVIFGEAGQGFMRLNMGAPQSLIMEALDKVAAALQKLGG